MKLALALAGAIALAVATPAAAQSGPDGIVQIYHVAPGHQVDFLKWLDQQDKIAASAGVPAGKLYAHMDGDSWDYLVIAPVTTPAQDAALDAAAKSMGINVMRKHVPSHTETFVRGPTTAAAYLAAVGAKSTSAKVRAGGDVAGQHRGLKSRHVIGPIAVRRAARRDFADFRMNGLQLGAGL